MATAIAAGASASVFLGDTTPNRKTGATSHTNQREITRECDVVQRGNEPIYYVGLAHVVVPKTSCLRDTPNDQMKNDAVLDMAIREVEETLYVYVDHNDKHAALTYVSELHNLTWDIACAYDKYDLDINIVHKGDEGTWDELLSLPEIEVVYGVGASMGMKSYTRNGLLPLQYRSPEAELVENFFPWLVDCSGRSEVVIVNGTFDHLHNGHKRLLSHAVSMCKKKLVVGIQSSQEILQRKPHCELIEPLDQRKRKVMDFVQSMNTAIDVVVVDVEDDSGPVASWGDSLALAVVSSSDVRQFKQAYALSSVSRKATFLRRIERSTLRSSHIRAQLVAASIDNY